MIRLLHEEDRIPVLHFLYQESTYNIFIIGDIETYGFNESFQRIYAEYDEAGNLLSVFLRYREHAVYYAPTARFNHEYLSIFDHDPFNFISGKSELMTLIEPHLIGFKKKHMYFCEAKKLTFPLFHDPSIHMLQSEDQAYSLFKLLSMIEEFNYHDKEADTFVKEKMQSLSMGMTLFIEENNTMVSTVATAAETTKNAMVVAVATHPDHRHHGYASRLMKRLMTVYLHDKGKSLCLFYNNPDAGKIYHQLGFNTIGTWDMFNR